MSAPDGRSSTAPRKRRWYQFSLRTLMIVMLLASVAMSWFAVKLQQARRQREAVAAIREAGGDVLYAHECKLGRYVPASEPPGPKCLRELLGEDFFATPVRVDLIGVADDGTIDRLVATMPNLEFLRLFNVRCITDDGLSRLADLPKLKSLQLRGSNLTDAQLAYVASLTQLECLDLEDTGVGDDGLAHVAELTKLCDLYLSGTKVTDSGLSHLKGLRQVRLLSLLETDITDDGLARLAGLTQLEVLSLASTKVTDAGLEHLAGLTQLEYLGLSRTQVTDDGLRHLAKLVKLCDLDLAHTKISADGLAHLTGLRKLTKLTLSDTNVTDEGLVHVAKLTQLESLDLVNTPATDDGLLHLTALRQLKRLALSRVDVTSKGVAQLQNELPNLLLIVPVSDSDSQSAP